MFANKLYKTGQTRGADDDEIIQNRVLRSSTVLIPFVVWSKHFSSQESRERFGLGYTILIHPGDYFDELLSGALLAKHDLALGENALVFYETRSDWVKHNPDQLGWKPATSRTKPLGGQYVARIPGTTAAKGDKIFHGFTTTKNKGAGIWVYEYASASDIDQCRAQLEALFWFCADVEQGAVAHGMTDGEVKQRRDATLERCMGEGLLDFDRLIAARVINKDRQTICPLCRKLLSSEGFFARMEQAVGREVGDLTVTELNLFHIDELRIGSYNHRPYNVGWGHHHCNVVVKDAGIQPTLQWMAEVLERNREV